MKKMMALFAFSFAALLAMGASTPASAHTPAADDPSDCPVIWLCADQTQGSAAYCADHGGTVYRLWVCGIQF
jgi:hypothetical protein